MSDTRKSDDRREDTDKREEAAIANEFEGLDNDLVNVGKFTHPEADPGSPDTQQDHAERPNAPKPSDVGQGPASDSLDTIRRP